MDKISVIIPVYKTEKYLDKCVKSIVNQTYKNLEIILVDDESPDNCPKMCDDWAKKDSRIKVLHIKNMGVANARNTGLKVATGNYLSFVDSDDYAEPDMMETLYGCIKINNADIAVCDFFGGEYESEMPDSICAKDALKKIATGDFNFGVLWNKLYKKEIIQGIEMPPLVCCEDLVFNYFVFKKSEKVILVKEKKYHYVYHNSSATKGEFNSGAFDAVKSKEIILNDAKETPLEPYAVRGLINSCFVVLSGAIQAGGYEDECEHLRRTILNYKQTIAKSDLYSKKDKIKTAILSASKKLYIKFIERKN